ncbi:YutD family protein [Secundilactobacillus yichangensis]|uniref:YutD family protein n=1 Tax=Secundilactobacillus yichangensis TaxID=2799580 RepID=UPI0019457C25|nr:YutD family protein [Secundilactobacillus yichangensis]
MDKKALQTLIDDARASREPGGVIVAVDETHYQINEHPYELMVNYRDAFDRVELSDRFNTYFSRYDYLVGDWGFGQLRLRGFYDDKRNVAGELKISALQDYLDEACNTGCPYFVMHNEDAKVVMPKRSSRQRESSHRSNRNQNNGAKQQNRNHSGNRNKNAQPAERKSERPNASKRSHARHTNRPSNNGQQKAYTVEKVKPVKKTPVSQRHGTVKTVGHSQHRKFTIREKKD